MRRGTTKFADQYLLLADQAFDVVSPKLERLENKLDCSFGGLRRLCGAVFIDPMSQPSKQAILPPQSTKPNGLSSLADAISPCPTPDCPAPQDVLCPLRRVGVWESLPAWPSAYPDN